MEDDEEPASYGPPQPPPFYKHFTTQNLDRLKEIQEAAASESKDNGEASTPKLLDLPPELRYLIPPEPPADGIYKSFGETKHIQAPLSSLKEFDIEQLYPSSPTSPSATEGVQSDWTLDRAVYLKKIARSILLNFLELVGVLSVNPMQYDEKVADLRTLYANAHHLINEYRPHQARETLILMMEDQLEKARAEVEGIKGMKQKINDVLGGLGKATLESTDGIPLEGENLPPPSPEEKRKEEQRLIWNTLNDEEWIDG
ncbi:MED7-domain-containing protein [Mytilinidion resinicola]|uniref:Mediator of RNA polymerase II transcription subunit 7 n=1 Tax=Mytilinidion resinicola TaxID=574789 RepID=A0A6A6YA77_9PEZI|nr:MED7-domain-containing protein [Mytilinidion resinicola]KAF2804727.1 MED7-domain-containing protein [Mytilinidion resinicola]